MTEGLKDYRLEKHTGTFIKIRRKNWFYSFFLLTTIILSICLFCFLQDLKGMKKEIESQKKQTQTLQNTINIQEQKLKSYSGYENRQNYESAQKDIEYVNNMLENFNLGKLEFKDELKAFLNYPVKFPQKCYFVSKVNEYGYRYMSNPVLRLHHGFDVTMVFDQDVISMMDGMVYAVGFDSKIGNYLQIVNEYFGREYMVVNFHLSEIKVIKNQEVKQGNEIGEEGNTGVYCNGYHLHFAVYKKTKKGWKSINPFKNSLHRKYEDREFLIYSFLME